MKYAKIKYNDVANCPGIALSVYTQGCPHHCKNCFNPETWDFDGGEFFTQETLNDILNRIQENGIRRSLCILGGEPLCSANLHLTELLTRKVKETYPKTRVYIWSGYTYEELKQKDNQLLKRILRSADYLIDGPYIDAERDITLKMRGSRNQRIIDLATGGDVTDEFERS